MFLGLQSTDKHQDPRGITGLSIEVPVSTDHPQNHWKSRLTDTTVQWKVRPSEAKGRGFDPRQPHHFDTFLITPLFSGFVGGLELDSLDLATLRPVI